MTSDIAKKIGNIFTGNNHFVFIKELYRESLVSISVFLLVSEAKTSALSLY